MRKIIVTGSAGLIGSETVNHFAQEGYRVIGIDNDMRSRFFVLGFDADDHRDSSSTVAITNITIRYPGLNGVMDYQGTALHCRGCASRRSLRMIGGPRSTYDFTVMRTAP